MYVQIVCNLCDILLISSAKERLDNDLHELESAVLANKNNLNLPIEESVSEENKSMVRKISYFNSDCLLFTMTLFYRFIYYLLSFISI